MDPETQALYAQLFPEVATDLTTLTDEQLDELIGGFEQSIVRIATGEAFAEMEDAPDRNARRDALRAGRDQLLSLRTARDERTAEAETFAAEVAEIAAEAGVELATEAEASAEGEGATAEASAGEPTEGDGEGETPAEPTEGEGDGEEAGEGEGEGIQAAATAPVVYRHRPPATPRRNQPLAAGDRGPALVASAGLETIGEGQELDRDGLAVATLERLRRFVATPKGFSEKVVIASARWGDQYPDERRLDGRSIEVDQAKLDGVRSRRVLEDSLSVEPTEGALVAAGGWCAPSVIRYDVGTLGTQERPVRDALTAFNATRGGLQYLPDFSIATTDTTDGISRFTEAEDAEGGSLYIKECVVVECPEFSDVRADIISTCLQAGNLASIAFPELIAAWQDLLGVAAARNRDGGLLDAIRADAQTKEVTVAANTAYGLLSHIATGLLKLAAGYRSRHRLPAGAVLRSLAPAWLADAITLDLINRQFPFEGGGTVTRAGIAAMIQRLTQVNVEWYLDSSSTGTSQIFDAQAEAAVDPFPDDAEVYLYPEGGIGFIDAGELNIGLVRDSALNETNDVRFFAEVFENAAVFAAEVFVATFEDVCHSGTTAPTATAITC